MVILLNTSRNTSDIKRFGEAILEKNRFTRILSRIASLLSNVPAHYLGSVAGLAKHLHPEFTTDVLLLV
jgi:hypothetical protein